MKNIPGLKCGGGDAGGGLTIEGGRAAIDRKNKLVVDNIGTVHF